MLFSKAEKTHRSLLWEGVAPVEGTATRRLLGSHGRHWRRPRLSLSDASNSQAALLWLRRRFVVHSGRTLGCIAVLLEACAPCALLPRAPTASPHSTHARLPLCLPRCRKQGAQRRGSKASPQFLNALLQETKGPIILGRHLGFPSKLRLTDSRGAPEVFAENRRLSAELPKPRSCPTRRGQVCSPSTFGKPAQFPVAEA